MNERKQLELLENDVIEAFEDLCTYRPDGSDADQIRVAKEHLRTAFMWAMQVLDE